MPDGDVVHENIRQMRKNGDSENSLIVNLPGAPQVGYEPHTPTQVQVFEDGTIRIEPYDRDDINGGVTE